MPVRKAHTRIIRTRTHAKKVIRVRASSGRRRR